MSADPLEKSPSLFHSPLGLYDFQADATARIYWRWTTTTERTNLLLYDTGIGKTVISLALAATLVEDDLIDHVVVVVEKNKVLDWVEDDFPKFTDLSVAKYGGQTIEKRKKILAALPHAIVMSYETGRNDICEFRSARSNAVTGDKMLTEALLGKRVLFVFDEFSRLRNRGSKTYLAWDYLLNRRLRRSSVGMPYVIGLTATTVEKHPDDHWNACRLLSPERAGSVAYYEHAYVATRSVFDGSPSTWKNLTPEAQVDPEVVPLNRLFADITLRKRKTDADVIDFFPKKVENPPTVVRLGEHHQGLYDQIEEIFADEDLAEEVSRQGFGLLRQIAGHPMSLLRSSGGYAREIVSQVGAGFLEEIGCAKVDALLDWQRRVGDQQSVVFTFYGGSILPYLEHSLRQEGYTVSVNHGRLSDVERKRQQDAYKAGDTQVFLTSDAGAKGLNLGVGSALLHYETPLLYSTFVQRSDRIHRIDSRHPSVTIDYLLVKDTIEEAVTRLMLKRNDWAEKIQDPDLVDDYEPTEGYLRARDRLAMLRRAA